MLFMKDFFKEEKIFSRVLIEHQHDSLAQPEVWGGVGDPGGAEEGDVAKAGEEEGLQAGVVVGQHTAQAVISPGVKLN